MQQASAARLATGLHLQRRRRNCLIRPDELSCRGARGHGKSLPSFHGSHFMVEQQLHVRFRARHKRSRTVRGLARCCFSSGVRTARYLSVCRCQDAMKILSYSKQKFGKTRSLAQGGKSRSPILVQKSASNIPTIQRTESFTPASVPRSVAQLVLAFVQNSRRIVSFRRNRSEISIFRRDKKIHRSQTGRLAGRGAINQL